MSLDLYQDEARERLSTLRPVTAPETGAFDGFVRGTGMYAMRGLAKTARALDLAARAPVVAADYFANGTEISDRLFKQHDDIFNSAVDYWTPKPNEVGSAAEIVGGLIGQLPTIIASPHIAVGAQLLDTAEDLSKAGVDSKRAIATGVVQATGLATGIWMPVIGQNFLQRAIVGGAGFNALQGVVTRGASGMILEGTPAADAFKAIDPKAMTLDTLLGFAFGSWAHISPAQREHGAAVWQKVKDWAENLSPGDVAAIATLRTAQHLNEDSLPGKPVSPSDVEAHTTRVRQAVDQLLKGEPVQVEDLPAAEAKPDPQRFAQAAKNAEQLTTIGERVAKAEGIPERIEDTAAAAKPPEAPEGEGLVAKGGGAEPPPPRGESAPSGQPGAEPASEAASEPKASPLELEGQRIAAENPDLQIVTGHDADGKPIVKSAKDFIADADGSAAAVEEEQSLIRAAASCLLGIA